MRHTPIPCLLIALLLNACGRGDFQSHLAESGMPVARVESMVLRGSEADVGPATTVVIDDAGTRNRLWEAIAHARSDEQAPWYASGYRHLDLQIRSPGGETHTLPLRINESDALHIADGSEPPQRFVAPGLHAQIAALLRESGPMVLEHVADWQDCPVDALAFHLFRKDNAIHCWIVNHYSANVFIESSSAKLAGYISSENPLLFMARAQGGSFTMGGGGTWKRLSYHPRHSNGELCGLQLTPLPPFPITPEAPSDARLRISTDLTAYLGREDAPAVYRTLRIHYDGPLSDLPLHLSSEEQAPASGKAALEDLTRTLDRFATPAPRQVLPRHQENGMDLPLLSADQSERLIGFMTLATRHAHGPLPADIDIPASDVFFFQGTTGIHRVLWQGADSLHQVQWFTPDATGTIMRVGMTFTVSPAADPEDDLRTLVDEHRITQQHTWAAIGDRIHTLSIDSQTDPVRPAAP